MENSKNNNEIDFIDLIVLFIKKKTTILLITSILTFIYAAVIFYNQNFKEKITNEIATINILIADHNNYTAKQILVLFNIRLHSAINFENWSKENPNLVQYLSQRSASIYSVHDKTHMLDIQYYSEENLSAIVSYVNFSAMSQERRIRYLNELKKEELIKRQKEDLKDLNSEIETLKNRILNLVTEKEIYLRQSEFLESYIEANADIDQQIVITYLESVAGIPKNDNLIIQVQNRIVLVNSLIKQIIQEQNNATSTSLTNEEVFDTISMGQVTTDSNIVSISRGTFLYLSIPIVSIIIIFGLLMFFHVNTIYKNRKN